MRPYHEKREGDLCGVYHIVLKPGEEDLLPLEAEIREESIDGQKTGKTLEFILGKPNFGTISFGPEQGYAWSLLKEVKIIINQKGINQLKKYGGIYHKSSSGDIAVRIEKEKG